MQVMSGALVGKVFSAATGYTPAKGDIVEVTGDLEVNKPDAAGSQAIVGRVVALPPGVAQGKCTVECRGQRVSDCVAGAAVAAGASVYVDADQRVRAMAERAAASLQTGVELDENAILVTARIAGEDGNAITLELIDPAANSSPLSLEVEDRNIRVYLATDGAGAITSTAAEVIAALNAGLKSATTPDTLQTGVVGSNNALDWNSPLEGQLGNLVTFEARDPGGNNQALAIAVKGLHVDVSLATDGGGAITTTAAQLRAALLADTEASALLAAVDTTGSDGSGVLAAISLRGFSGAVEGAPTDLLVSAANAGDSDGSGVVTALAATALAGGTHGSDPRARFGLALQSAASAGDPVQVLEG